MLEIPSWLQFLPEVLDWNFRIDKVSHRKGFKEKDYWPVPWEQQDRGSHQYQAEMHCILSFYHHFQELIPAQEKIPTVTQSTYQCYRVGPCNEKRQLSRTWNKNVSCLHYSSNSQTMIFPGLGKSQNWDFSSTQSTRSRLSMRNLSFLSPWGIHG